MTQNPTTQVVGKGVYLEFTKGPMTTQLLILPEAMSSSGKLVPMTMFRRRLSPAAPRKTWKASASPLLSSVARSYGPSDTTQKVAQSLLSFTNPMLGSLKDNGWTPYKEPIVIEVTLEDIDLVRQAKTPYKVIGRVLKARKALGFPKEIIHQAPIAV